MLEVTARAITYYLDVSAECTRRIVGVDGAIKALCNRLVVVELNNRTSRDLAEQCVKVGGKYSYLNTRGDNGAGIKSVARKQGINHHFLLGTKTLKPLKIL